MKKKRKLITSGVALAVAAVLALTGTLAWQSISQRALGERIEDSVNPGGRLHDDFNGTNKDIYVENFGEKLNIFARVRLDEYMESGRDAGKPDGASKEYTYSLLKGKDGAADPTMSHAETWRTRTPDTDDLLTEYWTWDLDGGGTVYMPTFNKNKDSLASDINGTYAGKADTELHYDDYVTWEVGQETDGKAVYDADENDVEETEPEEGVDIKTVDETHKAKETLTSESVKTMEQWLQITEEKDKTGNFWVWDEDGWFYWAKPIEPGTATGLLLDGIKLEQIMDDPWYYGVNVVAQFATAGDLGQSKEELGAGATKGTGFYDTDKGSAPTENAVKLLEALGAEPKADTVTVTQAESVESYPAGQVSSIQFAATATKHGKALTSPTFTWDITGNTSSETVIDPESGALSISAAERGTITVRAAYAGDSFHRYGTYTVNGVGSQAAPAGKEAPHMLLLKEVMGLLPRTE